MQQERIERFHLARGWMMFLIFHQVQQHCKLYNIGYYSFSKLVGMDKETLRRIMTTWSPETYERLRTAYENRTKKDVRELDSYLKSCRFRYVPSFPHVAAILIATNAETSLQQKIYQMWRLQEVEAPETSERQRISREANIPDFGLKQNRPSLDHPLFQQDLHTEPLADLRQAQERAIRTLGN